MLMKGMLMLPSNLDPKLHHPKSDPKAIQGGGGGSGTELYLTQGLPTCCTVEAKRTTLDSASSPDQYSLLSVVVLPSILRRTIANG